jgi:hypothetical protein
VRLEFYFYNGVLVGMTSEMGRALERSCVVAWRKPDDLLRKISLVRLPQKHPYSRLNPDLYLGARPKVYRFCYNFHTDSVIEDLVESWHNLLMITKKTIDRHNAYIWADSAIFSICITLKYVY